MRRRSARPVTAALLLPIFFVVVVVGLATQVSLLNTLYLWGIRPRHPHRHPGKWGGSMVAARVRKETWGAAAAIAILMDTRGFTELVTLTVGLQLGVIIATVFTIMVLMALPQP